MGNSLSPYGMTHQNYKNRLNESLQYSWPECLAMRMWEEKNDTGDMPNSLPILLTLTHECTSKCSSASVLGHIGGCNYSLPDEKSVKDIAATVQWLLGTNVGRSFVRKVNDAITRIGKADDSEVAFEEEMSRI